jgi:hypothetical protein
MRAMAEIMSILDKAGNGSDLSFAGVNGFYG